MLGLVDDAALRISASPTKLRIVVGRGSPNPWPLLVGWLLLAFSLSMVVWPVGWLPRRAREWWIATQCTKRLPTAS
jgi:hypothetical protein